MLISHPLRDHFPGDQDNDDDDDQNNDDEESRYNADGKEFDLHASNIRHGSWNPENPKRNLRLGSRKE